jgi:repressor LexA
MTSGTAEVTTRSADWTGPDPDHVLSERQQRILHAIADFARRRGYAPTLREIGDAAGLASTSSVSHQLATLQRKGYLRRDPRRPRTIELRLPGQPAVRLEVEDLAGTVSIPPRGPDYVPVPDRGRIAAGLPKDLAEHADGDLWELPKELTGEGTLFRLQVRGDSMINAAIADGDVVVVRKQPQAENGEIVAAMIDGEMTVKTLQRGGDQVWLMPHNPSYQPIPGKDATILGKVVTVLRRIR